MWVLNFLFTFLPAYIDVTLGVNLGSCLIFHRKFCEETKIQSAYAGLFFFFFPSNNVTYATSSEIFQTRSPFASPSLDGVGFWQARIPASRRLNPKNKLRGTQLTLGLMSLSSYKVTKPFLPLKRKEEPGLVSLSVFLGQRLPS